MDFVQYVPAQPLSPVGKYAQLINTEAASAGVPPCALAAIVQRESGGRNILQEGVAPGPGCGVGLTQITFAVNWSDPTNPTYDLNGNRYELLDPKQNLEVSAQGFLRPAIDAALKMRAAREAAMDAYSSEILFFAFGIYNAGSDTIEDAIIDGKNPDAVTTDDYCSGVLAIYHELCAQSHTEQE